jgi:hypothetical protein
MLGWPTAMSRFGFAAAFLAVSLGATRAHADVDPRAAADALFQEGRAALARGDFEAAASKFAESQRLDPAAGTLLNLATAETKIGKLSSAWSHARAALEALPDGDERIPIAKALFDDLDRRVPRLTIKPRSPSTIRLDAVTISPAMLGVALPLDPGLHVVEVGKGETQRRYEVALTEGQSLTLEVEPPPDQVPPSGDARRPLAPVGWGLVAASGIVTGAGLVAGVFALDRKSKQDAGCDARGCDDAALRAASEGDRFATWSTIGVIGGVGLAAAGVAVLVFGPRESAPTVAIGAQGLVVSGRF